MTQHRSVVPRQSWQYTGHYSDPHPAVYFSEPPPGPEYSDLPYPVAGPPGHIEGSTPRTNTTHDIVEEMDAAAPPVRVDPLAFHGEELMHHTDRWTPLGSLQMDRFTHAGTVTAHTNPHQVATDTDRYCSLRTHSLALLALALAERCCSFLLWFWF